MTLNQRTAGAASRATTVAAAVGIALGLAACTPFGVACPAVAYIYSVDVTTDGATSIEACVADECVTSLAPSLDGIFTVSQSAPGEYSVDFFTGTPDAVTVAAFDAAGVELARDDFALEWTRTGGSEQCGGPASTPGITLKL